MQPAGIIELGVPPKHKKAFYGITKQLVIGEDKNFVYLQPLLKAKLNSGTGPATIC
jgi:DNA ligase 1